MAIEKMKKVLITGEKEYLKDVLDFLQNKSIFHINFAEPDEELQKKIKPALSPPDKEKHTRITRVLDICRTLKKESKSEKFTEEILPDIDKIEKKIHRILKEHKEHIEEEKKLADKNSLYSQYTLLIQSFIPLLTGEDHNLSEEQDILGILVLKRERKVLERLFQLLEKNFKEDFKIITAELKKGYSASLVFYNKKIGEKLREILWQEGISEIRFPSELKEMGFQEALVYLKKELEKIPEQRNKIQERKKEFLKENGSFINTVYQWTSDLSDYFSVKEKSVFLTEFFFYLESFIPAKFYNEIKEDFEKNFKDKAIFIEEPISPHSYEEVPVRLKNFSFTHPFSSLLNFFSLPVYGTVDPTPFLTLFFPLYFGFMLGDIGYGAIGLFLFLFLYKKFKNIEIGRNLSIVFISACIWTFLFGFLYGEFFGDIGEKLGLHPFFHRTHNANSLLLYAIIFGTLQVSLGLFLGFINNLKLHHIKHALSSLSMLFGLWFILGLAGVSLKVLPNSLAIYFGAGLFFFSILASLFHGGIAGIIAPVEIFSAFAHILSFARLMAIGLSSAILAFIANQFHGLIPHILFGFFIIIVFHILALVLGLFDPTIQGLRLQFVEFFTKFYKPGGKPYSPFIKRTKLPLQGE